MHDFSDRSQFRIGELLVMPDRLIVVRDGEGIHLQPRIIVALTLLAEEPGIVLSPEILLVKICRSVFYNNNPVQKLISSLWKSISDTTRNPRYIEAATRLGYRLIASASFPKTRPRI